MKLNNFNVTSKVMQDVAVIYPKGYLNNIVGENLVEECNACLRTGIKSIVLNFSEMEFINSIGISMLLAIVEKLKACKGTLCFTNMNRMYEDTFDMLGLTKYIQVFANEDDALRHLTAGATEQ